MPDPQDSLKQLTEDYVNKQQDNARIKAELDILSSRIKDLTKITGEIDQKVAGYSGARAALDTQRSKLEKFVTEKETFLKDTLPDEKEKEIEKKQTDSDEWVKNIAGQVATLNTQIDEKQKAIQTADSTLSEKKAAYSKEVDRVGSITKALKDLQDLEKLAIEQNQKNNLPAMYFVVLEMKRLLDQSKLPKPEEYGSSLARAGAELEQAVAEERSLRNQLEILVAERNVKQKQLDEATLNRRKMALEDLGSPP